jgi:hypothetical protein
MFVYTQLAQFDGQNASRQLALAPVNLQFIINTGSGSAWFGFQNCGRLRGAEAIIVQASNEGFARSKARMGPFE